MVEQVCFSRCLIRGGVHGGITTGETVLVRAAVKPASSIGKPQKTIYLQGEENVIVTEGRHDPCLCPRLVPVMEAMVPPAALPGAKLLKS